MVRINSLNGVANDLVQHRMSATFCAESRNMSNCLAKQLFDLKITNAELDLFTRESTPPRFTNRALRAHLKNLRSFLASRLKSNGFEKDFIQEGILKVKADQIDYAFNRIHVQCILLTKTGKRLESKNYTVQTKRIPDTFLQKVWKQIKKP